MYIYIHIHTRTHVYSRMFMCTCKKMHIGAERTFVDIRKRNFFDMDYRKKNMLSADEKKMSVEKKKVNVGLSQLKKARMKERKNK